MVKKTAKISSAVFLQTFLCMGTLILNYLHLFHVPLVQLKLWKLQITHLDDLVPDHWVKALNHPCSSLEKSGLRMDVKSDHRVSVSGRINLLSQKFRIQLWLQWPQFRLNCRNSSHRYRPVKTRYPVGVGPVPDFGKIPIKRKKKFRQNWKIEKI